MYDVIFEMLKDTDADGAGVVMLDFKTIRKRVCEELGTDYPEYARGMWCGVWWR